ncbi:hypothetical protein VHEMI09097 [[Torrubiella] hemipterigena]|nr:hypothetical protein VHEMI09097 [[Torrubiella] hemipterigena]
MCDVVASKLSRILSASENSGGNLTATPSFISRDSLHNAMQNSIDNFKRTAKIAEAEENTFRMMTYDKLLDFLRQMQVDQEHSKHGLQGMIRIQPFLLSAKQFCDVVGDMVGSTTATAFLFGPMKQILQAVSATPDPFNFILDFYEDIGESMPQLQEAQQSFVSKEYSTEVIVMVFNDVLEFHSKLISLIKTPCWEELFHSSWHTDKLHLERIRDSILQSRRLLEHPVTLQEFEEIRARKTTVLNEIQQEEDRNDNGRFAAAKQWLVSFSCEGELDRHRNTRSICPSAGQWLLEHREFKNWFQGDVSASPLFWLTGKPGAGKTILASRVIDAARAEKEAVVAFFFCKYGDDSRNTFISISRAMLAQIMAQVRQLRPYFHERASLSSDAIPTSTTMARDMLKTCLSSCPNAYLIVDGIDECGNRDRKEITGWFREITQSITENNGNSVKCLFISQEDLISRRALDPIPTLNIASQNESDLKSYLITVQVNLEAKFGSLQYGGSSVADILYARAQGMFIYAELMAKYLHDQPNRDAILRELHPTNCPIELNTVYDRILHRVFESRNRNMVSYIQNILGWIVYAKRPMRWREVQGAVCIDIEAQDINTDRMLLEPPEGLFASIIEVRSNGTVELTHTTAYDYLIKQDFIKLMEVDNSLAILCVSYLTLPCFGLETTTEQINDRLRKGMYAFHDYASACWSKHLLAAVSPAKPDSNDGAGQNMESVEKAAELQETLEVFVGTHMSPSSATLLPVSKRITEAMVLFRESNYFDDICQAVTWSVKQLGIGGKGPTKEEALDLWRVTANMRSVFETLSGESEMESLACYYGTNWFKCPRLSCYFYHEGFATAAQRDRHVERHERPFMCVVIGCHLSVFGCSTESELKAHILNYHGIDMIEEVEFPPLPKNSGSNRTAAAKYQCDQCQQTFTRRHNLNAHMRSHTDIRNFICSVCSKAFVRSGDRDRHQQGHGEKRHKCEGLLKDGSTWGCKAVFARYDILASHFGSAKGQKCIRPLKAERLQEAEQMGLEGTLLDKFLGSNPAMLAAGSLLSFNEFLKLCKLEPTPKSTVERH